MIVGLQIVRERADSLGDCCPTESDENGIDVWTLDDLHQALRADQLWP